MAPSFWCLWLKNVIGRCHLTIEEAPPWVILYSYKQAAIVYSPETITKWGSGYVFPTNECGTTRERIYQVCTEKQQAWKLNPNPLASSYNCTATSIVSLWLPTQGCKSKQAVLSAFSSHRSKQDSEVLSPMLSLAGRWHPPVLLKASAGSTSTTPRLCYLPASAAFSCFSYVSNPPNTHVGVPKLKIAARKKNTVQSERWSAAELFIPTYPSRPRVMVLGLHRCSLAWGLTMPRRDNNLAGVCPLGPLSESWIPHKSAHLSFYINTSCHVKKL